jgi:hypothetical protein
MWMDGQYQAVPLSLAHCPFDRQRNPCNFMEMGFTGEGRGLVMGKTKL